MYCSCIMYLDEWFVERKGLAFGVMWVSLEDFFDKGIEISD